MSHTSTELASIKMGDNFFSSSGGFSISSESFKLIEVVNTTRVCGAHHTFNHIHTVVLTSLWSCPSQIYLTVLFMYLR